MILPENKRIARYTKDYFTKRKIPEIQSWHNQIIRTDIAACLCYALGYTRTEEVDALRKMSGIPYKKHLLWIGGRTYRKPKLVVDIGAGRGEILALFSLLGIDCVGIDPSPGSKTLVPKTMLEWAETDVHDFYNLNAYQGMCEMMGLPVDTIIMCESLEHIREEEFDATWPLICEKLTETNGLFIVANMLKKHPIRKDGTGYDHIRRVDDKLYNKLEKNARKVLVRRGSHMVLQF